MIIGVVLWESGKCTMYQVASTIPCVARYRCGSRKDYDFGLRLPLSYSYYSYYLAGSRYTSQVDEPQRREVGFSLFCYILVEFGMEWWRRKRRRPGRAANERMERIGVQNRCTVRSLRCGGDARRAL
jgi:hypothetical protein